MPFSLDHDLSEELLVHIFLFCSQGSLVSLCRSSKKFNRIATPHLYSAPFLRGIYDVDLKWILPFALLIWNSPSHASLVRSLTIRLDEEAIKEPVSKNETPDLEKALTRACGNCGIEEDLENRLYEKLNSGAFGGPGLALLLVNLPNLQTLDVHCDYDGDKDMAAIFQCATEYVKLSTESSAIANNKRAVSDLTPFSVPLDILVTDDNGNHANDPQKFAVFLNLPNLRSIYGWKMGDENEDEERSEHESDRDFFSGLKARSCPVKYMECRMSKFNIGNFKHLMNATIPGKLKIFLYEIGCTWAWATVEHEEIMKGLTPHYDTLECLGLSHEQFYPYQSGTEVEKPYPVSLRCFKKLKRLQIAPVYIWGHDGFTHPENLKKPETHQMLWKALPETLEELWITRAEEQRHGTREVDKAEFEVRFVPGCLIPALELVVQNRDSYPNLAHLRIEFPVSYSPNPHPEPALTIEEEWLDPLVLFCHFAEAKGIRCIIIVNSLLENYNNFTEVQWGWERDVEWEKCANNLESPSEWIVFAEEPDLGGRLRLLKEEHEEVERLREKRRLQEEVA